MNPSEKTLKPLVVCAAVILAESKPRRGEVRILVAKRKPDAKVEAGKWEFPGGKLEFGEQPEACLIREIKEELDLTVEVERLFDVVSHTYVDTNHKSHIVLLCYLCRAKQTEFKLLDVADAKWVTPDELDDLDWAVADLPPLAKLKDWFDQRAMNAR